MKLNLFKTKDDRTPGKVLRRIENTFGTFVVKNGQYRGEEVRLYEVDGVRESATYFDDRKNELIFDYAKCFSSVLEENPGIDKVLMLGGAGFQYPKYFISHYPDKEMDVVEINPLSIHLARKYFYLNDLEKDFKAESSGRLKIIVRDGMEFLRETGNSYDMIINDAYHSNIPDAGLTSHEGTELIKSRLVPGGIYCLNLITSLSGKQSMPYNLMKILLEYHFDNVRFIKCTSYAKPESLQNILCVCG